MTVRANKPAFNVREKLKELERPIGIAGNQILKSDSAQDVRSYLAAGRKNLVINGDMRINQRYGTASAVVTDDYVLDRFKFKENHGGSASINRDQFPMGDNHPDGHRYAMQVACASTDTSLSGTEHSVIMHMIEGYNCIGTGFGTGEAKNVTLSFWVKTNCQGTYSVALKNSAQNKCMVKEYTAGEYGYNWQKIVITFPGCTDGSWLYDQNIGMKLEFALAAGTTYTTSDFGKWKSSNVFLSPNQVNFYQSTNNRFFITGIQLEIGDEATDFDHRLYGEELALCQRYYERHNWSNGQYVAASIHHGPSSGTSSRFIFPYLTRKRTTGPSFTASGSYLGYPPNETVTLTGSTSNDTAARVNVSRTTSYAPGTGILILSSGTGNYFEIEDEL